MMMRRSPKAVYNIHMIIILGIVLVGGMLLNRMIGSVQRQILALKKSFLELKTDLIEEQKPTSPIVNFEQSASIKNDDDDTVSVDSVDIDNIMRKLSSESESSVHRCNNFKVTNEVDKVDDSEVVDTSYHQEDECVEPEPSNNTESKEILIDEEDKAYEDMSLKELKATLKSRGVVNPKGNKNILAKQLNDMDDEQKN